MKRANKTPPALSARAVFSSRWCGLERITYFFVYYKSIFSFQVFFIPSFFSFQVFFILSLFFHSKLIFFIQNLYFRPKPKIKKYQRGYMNI